MIDNIENFDAQFFGVPAREAVVLDPQHRVFLECVVEALEDAGIALDACGNDIGVFAGASLNSYLIRNLACDPRFLSTPSGFMSLISNEKDYLATRVAYKLNLHGPALTVQTACSTSLVAVHLAAQSLILGECDTAIAGGVSIKVPQEAGYLHQEGMPFSKDGHCRSFDASGTGTVFGSGAGVVVLKTLESALDNGDEIYAIIRSSACNNDGNRKVGFVAPSVEGQAEVIRRALTLAETDPGDVGYVEAHGTATPLGDPIEVAALQQAYEGAEHSPCRIGSIKSNIGHMETAAGVAGLIKTALMLKNRRFLPSVGFEKPNPHIKFDGSRLRVQTADEEWNVSDGKPRKAGVSSFGMGGTNVHMILEEASAGQIRPGPVRPEAVLLLSAKSKSALAERARDLSQWLAARPGTNVHSLAAYLQTKRSGHEFRQAVVCHSAEDAAAALGSQPHRHILARLAAAGASPAFLYCGGGAQYPGMMQGLYEFEPEFRQTVDRCAQAFKRLNGHDLMPFFLGAASLSIDLAEQMQAPDVMFPALFTAQHAMGSLLESWGILPSLVMGHSNGEYAAAIRAGVMDELTAIELVAARSSLMMKLPVGGMISVPLAATEVLPFATLFKLSIGAENSARNNALSGEHSSLAHAKTAIEAEKGVTCRPIHVGAALHSHLMREIAEEFAEIVRKHRFDAPRIPWISSVTGAHMSAARAPGSEYWVRHLCQPVKFMAAAQTLLSGTEPPVVIDMGPGRVAGDLLRQNMGDNASPIVQMSRAVTDTAFDTSTAGAALAKLWTLGAPVDWHSYQRGIQPAKHDLPAYPWQRKRYWIDAPDDAKAGPLADLVWELDEETQDNEGERRAGLTSAFASPNTPTEEAVAATWARFFGMQDIGIFDSFIELGGTSLLATEVLAKLNSDFTVNLPLGQFLELGNISQIAARIEALVAANERDLMAEAMAEIEGKTEEELLALLQST